jgi:hypothetical protein
MRAAFLLAAGNRIVGSKEIRYDSWGKNLGPMRSNCHWKCQRLECRVVESVRTAFLRVIPRVNVQFRGIFLGHGQRTMALACRPAELLVC